MTACSKETGEAGKPPVNAEEGMRMSILKGAKAIGAYIGMSVPTFHRHKDVDGIPYYRAGRIICARTEKLDEWMEKGGSLRAEGGSEA